MNDKKLKQYLDTGKPLSTSMAHRMIKHLVDRDTPDIDRVGLLETFRHRPTIMPTELAGIVEGLRQNGERSTKKLPDHVIEMVGTGGDGHRLFNITTAAAIVAAAVPNMAVIKSGGGMCSSASGSMDVLHCLGIRWPKSLGQAVECAKRFGLAFVPSWSYCPSLTRIKPAREKITGPTIINMAMPLFNPLGVRRQVIGAFSPAAASLMTKTARILKLPIGYFLSGDDGLDEVTPAGTTTLYCYSGRTAITERRFDLSNMGLSWSGGLKYFEVTCPEASANCIWMILQGDRVAHRVPVIANAAVAIYAAGFGQNLAEAAQMATEAIDSKKALEKFVQVSEFLAAQ